MKICFVYGSFIGNRPINFNDLFKSPRGLTGSELSCICFAKEMLKLGHDVTLYIEKANADSWNGIKIKQFEKNKWQGLSGYDVVYSWNDPEVLKLVDPKSLRIVNQQINDFNFVEAGYDNYVDIYTSPSLPHKDHMVRSTGINPNKWVVIPNGCNPDLYTKGIKVPGRVIYASSPDRGLHHLLDIWPRIKDAVPEAHLKIFYDVDTYLKSMLSHTTLVNDPTWMEFYNRAKSISKNLDKLTLLGIEKIGSTSREQMAKEMSEAKVLAYPCDPIMWTEGFSVTTMEACASGTIPVISTADALGFIYAKYVPHVFMPLKWQLNDYANLVIKALRDEVHCPDTAELAEKHRWSRLANKLEAILQFGVKAKQ